MYPYFIRHLFSYFVRIVFLQISQKKSVINYLKRKKVFVNFCAHSEMILFNKHEAASLFVFMLNVFIGT